MYVSIFKIIFFFCVSLFPSIFSAFMALVLLLLHIFVLTLTACYCCCCKYVVVYMRVLIVKCKRASVVAQDIPAKSNEYML